LQTYIGTLWSGSRQHAVAPLLQTYIGALWSGSRRRVICLPSATAPLSP
jgi:hypothetical protein